MKEIAAFEAERRLGQVLDWVEAGEEVIITREGKHVARVVPAAGADPARAAAARIRARRRGMTLGGLPIKTLIDEGRL